MEDESVEVQERTPCDVDERIVALEDDVTGWFNDVPV